MQKNIRRISEISSNFHFFQVSTNNNCFFGNKKKNFNFRFLRGFC